MTFQKRNINKDICDCLHKLTSNFSIEPVLTTVYPFLSVHTGFRILIIAIISNWNKKLKDLYIKYNILGYEEVFDKNINIEILKQIVKFIEELNLKQ